MFKKLLNKKHVKNEKGLTLIELLAVIVILAIISAIAIPAIGNIIENSRYNAAKADAINVLNAANLYFTDEPDEPSVTVAKLKTDKYLDNAGTFEKVADSATVTKDSPNKLSATDVVYSGTDKKVSFSGATVQSINKDNQKGSDTVEKIEGEKTP
ncbi:prepilin-type N-terminal cleavage/methylation domain-containing protein [Lysinibacillus parviboronicapiens]|uniref:prepilin-type N-terminal cleavage/methylation domain-containing protein n=1 Tax=Lysinibacillus parviboronicapiens TaxID=436516 RepID=UPI000D3580A2|nr:prepilin-type N-terminal cleavage/methylation domain-containing protein [Lysinibacillus parviboronicapiens]